MTTNPTTQDNVTAETQTSTPKWKYINLTQGKRVKVSIEDYDYLSQFKWYWKWCSTNPTIGYAARMVTIPGQYYFNKKANRMQPKQRVQLMHRVILNVDATDKIKQIDHINHDTLDNRRENLRITTPAGNINNHRKTKRTTSGFRGVSQVKSGKWVVNVQVNKENVRVGGFATPQKAKREYNKIRKQLLEKHKDALTINE